MVKVVVVWVEDVECEDGVKEGLVRKEVGVKNDVIKLWLVEVRENNKKLFECGG